MDTLTATTRTAPHLLSGGDLALADEVITLSCEEEERADRRLAAFLRNPRRCRSAVITA